MKKIHLILLTALFILVGCSPASIETSTEDNSIVNIHDKEQFYNELKLDITNLFEDADILHITDINDEKGSIISTYNISNDFYIDDMLLNSEDYHLSIKYDNNKNYIQNISIFTEKDNYLYFTALVNIIMLNLNKEIDIEAFDAKYKLIDDIEQDVAGEEDGYSIFKSTSGEYTSVNIYM